MNGTRLEQMLRAIFGEKRLHVDEPMAEHTTFKVGGPADFLVEPANVDELRAARNAARASQAPWHVIGRGSNLLVADGGLRGLVIVLGDKMAQVEADGTTIRAEAGASNEAVAAAALEAGLAGYEFACGIPGSIGGAAIMNAGAYDGEFGDVCTSVTCLTYEDEVIEVPAMQADWGYRRSMMYDQGYIVCAATLSLSKGDPDAILARMADLTEQRESKQPLEMGSAGSTFKRPPGHYAGKLVQDAGLRGYTVGGAQVSEKHCGFVVNTGSATAADVRAVIEGVQRAVFADSGVLLEPEVRMWGFDD